jgi:hypothetical protein
MKKVVSFFLLLLFPTGVLVLRAGTGSHRWFIEGSLSGALLNPSGLNARADAQERQTAFNYRDNFEWARRSAGGTFSYTLEEPAGSGLPRIHSGFPVTLRIGRAVAPRVAVFAGLQFLDRGRTSTLQQAYEVSDRRPDQVSPGDYELSIAYPGFFMKARAWLPQLGVRFDLLQRRSWTGGVRLAAGPMFAALRLIEERRYKRTDADGYWSESRYRFDMKGSGTGAAAEAAVFLALAVSPRLQLALEGGYALRTGTRFSGPGTYESQRRDANAAEDPTRSQWEKGDWRTQAAEAHQPWGDLYTTLPGNYFAGAPNAGKFRLDLSGWQLALGLKFAL